MQTINITLNPSGSVADFLQDFNIYQGSFNNFIINVAVPESVLPKTIPLSGDLSTVAVNIATTGNTRNGNEFQTEKHNLVWKKDFIKEGISYKLYGSTDNDNLDDFTQYSGAHTLVINVMNIIQGEGLATPVSVITSQECTLNILPSAYLSNGKPVVPSEIDKTNANVNYLLGMVDRLPLNENIVKKYNIADMPNDHTFTLNGYNEPLCAFYLITYNVPVNPNTTTTKSGLSVFSNVIPDTVEPGVIGYQNEYFLSDSGVIVSRTNKFNISQASIGNYTLLENGAWKIVNQDYIDDIRSQTLVNSEDITKLKRLVNTGTQYIGQYDTQEELPTDSELNAFVFEKLNRKQQAGDEVSFVQQMSKATDIIYNIRYSEVTQTWTATPHPSIEAAGNENLGLIIGSNNETSISELGQEESTRKVIADIVGGEIADVMHINENSEIESLSTQVNRNSNNLKINKENIETNKINIENEIARSTEANNENAKAISDEITRAALAEQTNATAIADETARAFEAETKLETNKLDKSSINENYIQSLSFALNGDTSVATATVKNPVSGENKEIEICVLDAANSSNTGLMTSEMVQSLTKAVADIETLKYLGRQLQSFPTYADAEAFDWSTTEQINVNDYFIVEADESRTEPSEHNKTTKYVCVDKSMPITTTKSFRFQMVVTTVVIQVATESSLGGVLSVNTKGYVYVEPNGTMKLVGYDEILTSITNLTNAIADETARAMVAEKVNADAIFTETTRAVTAEAELAEIKADKSALPTKTSDLNNDSGFITNSSLPTKTSQLSNDSNFATVSQIPTTAAQIGAASKADLAEKLNNYVDISSEQIIHGIKTFEGLCLSVIANKFVPLREINLPNYFERFIYKNIIYFIQDNTLNSFNIKLNKVLNLYSNDLLLKYEAGSGENNFIYLVCEETSGSILKILKINLQTLQVEIKTINFNYSAGSYLKINIKNGICYITAFRTDFNQVAICKFNFESEVTQSIVLPDTGLNSVYYTTVGTIIDDFYLYIIGGSSGGAYIKIDINTLTHSEWTRYYGGIESSNFLQNDNNIYFLGRYRANYYLKILNKTTMSLTEVAFNNTSSPIFMYLTPTQIIGYSCDLSGEKFVYNLSGGIIKKTNYGDLSKYANTENNLSDTEVFCLIKNDNSSIGIYTITDTKLNLNYFL